MPAHGTNTLLLGATGTGKTYCLRTLADAGLEVFIISTEPGIASTLGDTDPSKVHWHYIAPATASWTDMIQSAERINQLSFEALAKLPDINKRKYHEFMDVLTTCNDFIDDRTGQHFGDVSKWGPDKALVIDSLSGLNIMALNLVTGSKPIRSMADWGVSIDNLERLIVKLTTDTQCFFVLTAHLERETDEVTGGTQLMAATLGRKLAPRLPRFFDDVIHCKREGTSFSWSTATMNVDLKARSLPLSDKLQPNFRQIIEAWRKYAQGTPS
jgi:hypothetical protein